MKQTKEKEDGHVRVPVHNYITQPMRMIDHTCARIDGPPEIPAMPARPVTPTRKDIKRKMFFKLVKPEP